MRQLMRDHVLNAHLRSLNQFRIEEDALLADLAGTPAFFQALVDDLGLGDVVGTEKGVDLLQEAGEPLIGTLAVPGCEGALRCALGVVGDFQVAAFELNSVLGAFQ